MLFFWLLRCPFQLSRNSSGDDASWRLRDIRHEDPGSPRLKRPYGSARLLQGVNVKKAGSSSELMNLAGIELGKVSVGIDDLTDIR